MAKMAKSSAQTSVIKGASVGGSREGSTIPGPKAKGSREGSVIKAKDGKWIQKAIKKPGSLRKSLGVKAGKDIPAKKLNAAAKQKGKTTKKSIKKAEIVFKEPKKNLEQKPNIHVRSTETKRTIKLDETY